MATTYELLSAWNIPNGGYFSVHQHLGLDATVKIRVINNDAMKFYAVESTGMPMDHSDSMIVHGYSESQYSITSTGTEGKELWVSNKTSRPARVVLFQVVES